MLLCNRNIMMVCILKISYPPFWDPGFELLVSFHLRLFFPKKWKAPGEKTKMILIQDAFAITCAESEHLFPSFLLSFFTKILYWLWGSRHIHDGCITSSTTLHRIYAPIILEEGNRDSLDHMTFSLWIKILSYAP